MADFGNWAAERYRIPGDPLASDDGWNDPETGGNEDLP